MKDDYDQLYHDIEGLSNEKTWVPPTNDVHYHYDDEEYYHLMEDFHHPKHKHTCWKKAVSRESGFYPTCGKDGEQSGTYCYEKCEKGFTGVHAICYQDCNNFGGIIPPPVPGEPH